MIILRNFDFANKYFYFEKRMECETNSVNTIDGWYKIINDKLTALLVLNNNLYFIFDSIKYFIKDDFMVVLEKNDSSKSFVFNLMDGETTIVSFKYHLSREIINVEPFGYLDDEDFKWEEFIRNIINDENKKKNFINNLMELKSNSE